MLSVAHQMMKNKFHLRLFLILCCVCCFPILAQDDDALIPLDVALYDGHVIWSSDGRSAIMGQWDYEQRIPYWSQIDLETATVTRHDQYPLNPDLTSEEMELLDVSPVSFVSPDGRLLFYTKSIQQINEWNGNTYTAYRYAITNLETREIFETGIFGVPVLEEMLHVYEVIWSADSKSIVFETSGLSPYSEDVRIFHIRVEDEDDLQASIITEFNQTEVEGAVYDAINPFAHGLSAMSRDGERVLIYAALFDYETDIYSQPVVLIEWYPAEAEQSNVLGEMDGGVGFMMAHQAFYSPIDNDIISYWKYPNSDQRLQGNLYTYSPITGEENILWESPFPVASVSFSPDGNWGIFQNEARLVFLVDVASLYEAIDEQNGANLDG